MSLKKIDTNPLTMKNFNCLHLAACGNHVRILNYLKSYMDMHAVDNQKYSPLHFACESGSADAVTYLMLEQNLNPFALATTGFSAFDLCKTNKIRSQMLDIHHKKQGYSIAERLVFSVNMHVFLFVVMYALI